MITYGTYDLLHRGHVRLLERARALGDYLIVGVTSDSFDRARGKLNVFQPLSDRMNAVLATGIPDKVIVEEFQGQKVSDIVRYGADVFAIGSDWEGRFDYLKRYCEVVYLPRTEGVSSTELRSERTRAIRLGLIGATHVTEWMVAECGHVAGVSVSGLRALDGEDGSMAGRLGVAGPESLEGLLGMSDAVYAQVPLGSRADVVRAALDSGAHVLCEGAPALSVAEAEGLFGLARERGLVLMEANKTLYFPAFERLRLLVASGVVGEVKDVRASNSHIDPRVDRADPLQGAFYDMAPYITLPALALLGRGWVDSRLTCQYEGDYCDWARLDLLYPGATATLCAGQGVKTENDMVITGTAGYIHVPAPWWKTEYFEVRGEDLRDTRKHYHECAGTGLRYELFEFLRRVNEGDAGAPPARPDEDTLAVVGLVERFGRGDVTRLENGGRGLGGGETVTDR